MYPGGLDFLPENLSLSLSHTHTCRCACVLGWPTHTVLLDLFSITGFPGSASGKEPTCPPVGDVRDMGSIPGLGRSLEKEMATYSSILAWEIPWTEKPGRLQSLGSHRVEHDWSNLAHTHSALALGVSCPGTQSRWMKALVHACIMGQASLLPFWNLVPPVAMMLEGEMWGWEGDRGSVSITGRNSMGSQRLLHVLPQSLTPRGPMGSEITGFPWPPPTSHSQQQNQRQGERMGSQPTGVDWLEIEKKPVLFPFLISWNVSSSILIKK